MNIIAFIAMGIDKRKAKKKKWRTPEKVLMSLAVFGGSLGMIFGMKFFRHKTRHKLFYIGGPSILVIQLIIFCYSSFL
jgi:uncharacterized membrane protein YsdA (DUF1294 family)